MNKRANVFCWLCLQFVIGFSQNVPIIPQPHSVVDGVGYFSISQQDSFALIYSSAIEKDPVASNALELLTESLYQAGIKFHLQTITSPAYNFSVRRKLSIHADNAPSSFVLPKEGYWLKILPNEILGQADDGPGILYAIQSLRQLIQGQGTVSQKLNCVTIIDYPSFEFRGVMDDISRGPLPTLAFMKEQVRRLSFYKLNVFGFYIEHIIRTESHPDFSPVDGLTPTELIELSDYAATFNISILGSFQSLGHFRNILKSPAYQHLGISDRMLIPGDSAALQFLYDVYEEIIPAFSNPIFNINCDEVYDLSRSTLKPIVDAKGEAHLFSRHVTPLLEKVASLGKRPAMWGDMLIKYPSVLETIPKETLVFAWDYEAKSNFSKWTKPIAEAGLEFVVCPGILNSYKLWPDFQQTHDNIKRFANFGLQQKAMGVFTTVWDDGGRHFFHCDWYGVGLAGAYSWLPDSNAQADFDTNYDIIHFQDTGARYSQILDDLSSMKSIPTLSRLNNQLLEINYGSSRSSIECIDTTDFWQIRKSAQTILNDIEELIDHTTGNKSSQQTELEIWKFKVSELLLNIGTAESLLAINADEIGHSTIIGLNALSSKWQEKRNKFKILWLKENRNHWLDEAQEIYQTKGELLQSISNHIKNELMASNSTVSDNSKSYESCEGFHLSYWLGAGPFNANAGLDNDYLPSDGGESKIRPAAIDYFQNQKGDHQGWNKIISTRPGMLDFNDFYSSETTAIAYAAATIDSEIDQNIRAIIKFESPSIFYVNGVLMSQDLEREKGAFSIDLKKGRNSVLIKSINSDDGDWNFSFRILEQDVEQNKYRYYLK